MSKNRMVLLSALLLHLFWYHANGADNREALRFTISLDKRIYLVDEPVYLEMLATNISNREAGISDLSYNASTGHCRIILKVQYDQPVEYYGGEAYIVGFPDWWPGFIVAPGESWLSVIDLLSIFGKWGDAAHQIRLFLLPGTYNVQVIYDSSPTVYIANLKGKDDKQTLYSNVLQFEVVEPTGLEKLAHEMSIAAFTAYENRENPYDQRVLLLKKFIDKYMNSVYQPVVYKYLLHTSPHPLPPGYATERKRLAEEALARIPNSGLAYKLLLERYYDEIEDLAQAPTLTKPMMMQQLKIANANSRASFYAQCLVDKQRIFQRNRELIEKRYGRRLQENR